RRRATQCSSHRRRRRWTSSPTTPTAAGDSTRRSERGWEVRRMATPPRTNRPAKAERPGVSAARIGLGRVFRVESKDYFLLLGTTVFLVVFGLVMVLSSSSVESNLEDGGFFVQAQRQGLYAL